MFQKWMCSPIHFQLAMSVSMIASATVYKITLPWVHACTLWILPVPFLLWWIKLSHKARLSHRVGAWFHFHKAMMKCTNLSSVFVTCAGQYNLAMCTMYIHSYNKGSQSGRCSQGLTSTRKRSHGSLTISALRPTKSHSLGMRFNHFDAVSLMNFSIKVWDLTDLS